MPLDSDVPNGDDLLDVTFYTFEREPHKGQIFVKIITPGNQLNIVDVPAGEHHKRRFVRQWVRFQMQNSDGPVPGILLAEWAKERPQDISDMQLTELGILKFSVVEQLASATDSQLQRIGMGGVGLRQAAQAYLQHKRTAASNSELEDTKRQLAEMQKQMVQLMAQSEKRGPGRPPKHTED